MSLTTPNTAFTAGANRVTFTSQGETLVGTLHLPPSFLPTTGPLPAIVVSGPWTQVKEQVGQVYGTQLAEQGFAVLAFDPRFWGESGGLPRHLESTRAKAADIASAVAFLASLDIVDARRIGALGVCAGFGNVALAASLTPQIAAVAAVSPWLQHPASTPFFYGGEDGVRARVQKSQAATAAYAAGQEMPVVDAYNPADGVAAMFFPVDYYGNPQRGAVPAWENRFAVASWQEWLELDSIALADGVKVPSYILYGTQTFLPDNIRAFHDRLTGTKEIEQVTGEHTEFYDLSGEGEARQAVEKIAVYFKKAL